MNGANIWQLLCNHLTVKEVLRLRVLSRRHSEVGLRVAKERSILINDIESLNQIFKWSMRCAKVKCMITPHASYHSDGTVEVHSDENVPKEPEKAKEPKEPKDDGSSDSECNQDDGPVSYDFEIDQNVSFDGYYSDLEEGETIRLPNHIDQDSVVYLENGISLFNFDGPNHDSRGTVHYDLEMANFNDFAECEEGFISVTDLSSLFYDLKSHKFENWYVNFYHELGY